jgi:two-component system NarL family sensor kinase
MVLRVILLDDGFVLIVGTLALLLIVLFVILFAFMFQRKLIKKQKAFREVEVLLQKKEVKAAYDVLEAQELERKRIAEDLHDRVGSLLAAVKLHFHASKDNLDNQANFFSTGSKLLDEAIDEVRDISHNMVSGILSKFGLIAALTDLKTTLENSKQVSFQIHIHHLDGRLDLTIEMNLYRIVQELVSNILKHAQANEIILQLNRYESELLLIVEDNGIGFDPQNAKLSSGIGLSNIETRVVKMNGRLNIDSRKGQGTTVTIEIPIPHDQYNNRG